jgi:hypothetical protein
MLDPSAFGVPWLQISGAAAGGLVGGLAGFVANSVQQHREMQRARRNIACALAGEIEALCRHIENNDLARLRADVGATLDGQGRRYHHFRGERDYMPIFRSLGSDVGFLLKPLPSDLVYWYTLLAVSLERAAELHDVSLRYSPELAEYRAEVAELQRAGFSELIRLAKPLLERLSEL